VEVTISILHLVHPVALAEERSQFPTVLLQAVLEHQVREMLAEAAQQIAPHIVHPAEVVVLVLPVLMEAILRLRYQVLEVMV
jgi:hypothetical protein